MAKGRKPDLRTASDTAVWAAFSLGRYVESGAILKTVVRAESSRGLPSPAIASSDVVWGGGKGLHA
jgi:hypothetical protein